MSYKNVIDSNINLIKNAEIMYENDLKNLELNRGKNIDQYENEQMIKSINEKLNLLRKEKKVAFNKKLNKYNDNTKLLQAINDDNYKSDLLIKKQDKEINYNANKIQSSENDIITLRRQVEISQNQTLKRNNRLFLLKSLFVYLLILILPILLIKNNNISQIVGMISIGSITTLFVFIVLYNFYRHRRINNLHYDLTDWESPKLQDVIDEEGN